MESNNFLRQQQQQLPHQQAHPMLLQQQQQQQVAVNLIPMPERSQIEHTEDEVRMFGQAMNLDLDGEDQDLWWLAKHALDAPIPREWVAYQSSSSQDPGTSNNNPSSSGNNASSQPGQVVYVNQAQNVLTMQHPLTNYVKAVAQREQQLRRSTGQGHPMYEESKLDSAEHLWDEKCILKAQEVLSDLSHIKRSLVAQNFRKLEDIKRDYQALKEKNIIQFKQEISQYLSERESLLHSHLSQKLRATNSELNSQHEKHLSHLKRSLDKQLIQDKELLKAQLSSQGEGGDLDVAAEAEYEDEMIQFYEAEKERCHKKAREAKREAKEMITTGEIHEQIQREMEREVNRIKEYYAHKLAKQEAQIISQKNKHQKNISNLKQKHDNQHRERLLEAKSIVKTELFQKLDDLKADYERKLEQQKQKLDAKWSHKEASLPLETDGTFAKSIESYKRLKDTQLKQEKERIEEEYQERQIEEQKKQAYVKAQAYTLESVNKLIRNIKEQNQELSILLSQKVEELKELKPVEQPKLQSLNNKKQFETIGDVEQDANYDPRQSRARQAKSPIVASDRGFISPFSSNNQSSLRNLTPPHTHSDSSNISAKLLFFSTPSGSQQSYELLSSHKMKEIRSFVANELFKTQKKTQDLYAEFNRLKQIKEDMRELNKQAEMTLRQNEKKALQKMKLIDNKIDTEFNVVRTHLRNVQSKHDVLRRMRDALKKLSETVLPQQRVNLETELLNDYNYLRMKTREASNNAARSFKSDSSPYSRRRETDIMSEITTQTEYEKFMERWDKILKSGTSESGQYEWQYFNEYATMLLKRDDPAMATIKRFEKAIFDMKQIDMRAPLLRETGDKFSFRRRIFNKQNEKEKKAQLEILDAVNAQFRWLNQMKVKLNEDNTLKQKSAIPIR